MVGRLKFIIEVSVEGVAWFSRQWHGLERILQFLYRRLRGRQCFARLRTRG